MEKNVTNEAQAQAPESTTGDDTAGHALVIEYAKAPGQMSVLGSITPSFNPQPDPPGVMPSGDDTAGFGVVMEYGKAPGQVSLLGPMVPQVSAEPPDLRKAGDRPS